MSEGGQSATGALLDHIIRLHGAGGEPTRATASRGSPSASCELRAAEGVDFAGAPARAAGFPRQPLAARRPACRRRRSAGLTLDASFDGLCRLYWRTCVGIALGVRQILDALNAQRLRHRHAARHRRPHQEPAADGALCRRHRLHGDRADASTTRCCSAPPWSRPIGAGLYPDAGRRLRSPCARRHAPRKPEPGQPAALRPRLPRLPGDAAAAPGAGGD